MRPKLGPSTCAAAAIVMLVAIGCGVLAPAAHATPDVPRPSTSSSVVECPTDCDALFGKLQEEDRGSEGRGKVQKVEVQIRGEPKSGTGMTAEWAWGALCHTCLLLQKLYGKKSCRVDTRMLPEIPGLPFRPRRIVFEPRLTVAGGQDSPCSCRGVDRVEILLSQVFKHRLPVAETCAWWHDSSVVTPGAAVCKTSDGKPLQTQADLWRCVEDAKCHINRDRLQVAVIRDPRAVTVSAYFQFLRQGVANNMVNLVSVDEFFQAHLPYVCMWTSLRYLVFSKLLGDISEIFWYEDAVADPLDWNARFLSFVGVKLPLNELVTAATAAGAGGSILGFYSKGIDEHPGGVGHSRNRTFADELNESSLESMNGVLRTWLPPILLRRYGIAP